MKHLCAAAVLAASLSVPLHAQAPAVLLDERFTGTGSVLNNTVFDNWNVARGTVDLIRSGDFGITCVGASGYCVDLSGSSGATSNGRLETKIAYSFAAGDVVRYEATFSGNQRLAGMDNFSMYIQFTSTVPLIDYTTDFGDGPRNIGSFGSVPGNQVFIGRTVGFDLPFATLSIQFTAGSAGSAFFGVQTTSADDVGPIVDNVNITLNGARVSVPEPGSTMLLAVGLFGLAGRRLRRRVA